jgi:hypothetical protein
MRLICVLKMAGLGGTPYHCTAGVAERVQCWVVMQRSCKGETREIRWIYLRIVIDLGEVCEAGAVCMRFYSMNQ